jgi:hypothetical protein
MIKSVNRSTNRSTNHCSYAPSSSDLESVKLREIQPNPAQAFQTTTNFVVGLG